MRKSDIVHRAIGFLDDGAIVGVAIKWNTLCTVVVIAGGVLILDKRISNGPVHSRRVV